MSQSSAWELRPAPRLGWLFLSPWLVASVDRSAVFLIAWGRAPTANESLIGGLPWGDKLLQALRQIDPLISQRQDRWELDDLADRIDWAVQNLLNRKPPPKTTAEVAQWERDYNDWCVDVSGKLGSRVFSRALISCISIRLALWNQSW